MASAGVPSHLNYSGKLDLGGGTFDGSVDMTFTLYGSSKASEQIWQNTKTVEVVDGRFHVRLGESLGFGINANDLDVNALHLGIAVADDSEMPMVKISSVPYAMLAKEAANAATVGGIAASELAATDHTHNEYLTLADLATYDDDVTDDLTIATEFSGAITGKYDSLTITDGAVGVTALDTGIIRNAHIDDAAAIDGSKIDPMFGDQDLSTTGRMMVGTTDAALTMHVYGAGTTFARGNDDGGVPLAHEWALASQGEMLPDYDGTEGASANPIVEKGVLVTSDDDTRESIRFRASGSTDAGTGGIRWGWYDYNDFYLHRTVQSALSLDFFDYTSAPHTIDNLLTVKTNGHIGIGKTNPEAALDIQGTARSTSTSDTDDDHTLTTKDYVDALIGGGSSSGGSGGEGRMFQGVIVMNDGGTCPDGWESNNFSAIRGPNDYLYVHISGQGTFIGGIDAVLYGDEYLYVRIPKSQLTTDDTGLVCTRTFTSSSNNPHVSIMAPSTASCPTGYIDIPIEHLIRDNKYSYIATIDNGFFIGPLDTLKHVSSLSEQGSGHSRYNVHQDHNERVCVRVMGVDEDPETANGVYPVFSTINHADACPVDDGWTYQTALSTGRSDGQNHYYFTRTSSIIGGATGSGSTYGGSAYQYIYFDDAHMPGVCYKYFTRTGLTRPRIHVRLPRTGDCPSGYRTFDPEMLKYNGNGYIVSSADALFFGGLSTWATRDYESGTMRHKFSSQGTNKFCFKIDKAE